MKLGVINEVTGIHARVNLSPSATRSDLLRQIGYEGPCEITIDDRLVEGAHLTGIATDGSSTAVIHPPRPVALTVRVRDKGTGIHRVIRCSDSSTVGDVIEEWKRAVCPDATAEIQPIGVDSRTLLST